MFVATRERTALTFKHTHEVLRTAVNRKTQEDERQTMKQQLSTVLTLALLCGCSPDSRTARLEQRISVMESNHNRLQGSFDRTWTNQQGINLNVSDLFAKYGTNLDARNSLAAAVAFQSVSNAARIENIEAILTRARLFAPRSVAATRDGVPLDIYNGIADHARTRYPTDYDMQEYIIRQQIDAYKKLHP